MIVGSCRSSSGRGRQEAHAVGSAIAGGHEVRTWRCLIPCGHMPGVASGGGDVRTEEVWETEAALEHEFARSSR